MTADEAIRVAEDLLSLTRRQLFVLVALIDATGDMYPDVLNTYSHLLSTVRSLRRRGLVTLDNPARLTDEGRWIAARLVDICTADQDELT